MTLGEVCLGEECLGDIAESELPGFQNILGNSASAECNPKDTPCIPRGDKR